MSHIAYAFIQAETQKYPSLKRLTSHFEDHKEDSRILKTSRNDDRKKNRRRSKRKYEWTIDDCPIVVPDEEGETDASLQ